MIAPPPLPEPAFDPEETVVSVENVERTFENVQAVRGISFSIRRGEVVGFIGANGAGKTTTMRLMATLDLPSAGRIRVAGFDVVEFPAEVRRRVGWMPDAYGTYDHMTVGEYLDFFARACGLRGAARARRVEEVMTFADLVVIRDRFVNKLSKGMGQRLCFGRTLLHDPEVLILDEPAAGLDPKARVEFKRLVRLLANEGKTIFISSHILSELGEMCDSLLFIDAGRIVHHGTPASLDRHPADAAIVNVVVAGGPDPLVRWAALQPNVRVVEVHKTGARLEFPPGDPDLLAAQLRRMVLDGLAVTDFHREARRLEDAFVEMLRNVQP